VGREDGVGRSKGEAGKERRKVVVMKDVGERVEAEELEEDLQEDEEEKRGMGR